MKAKELGAYRPQHLLAKFIFFLLAIVIWLFVMRVAAPEYDARWSGVPVDVRGNVDGYTVTVEEETIDIRVFATKELLAQYGGKDITAYVDLSSISFAPEGGHSYQMAVKFETPEGVTVRDEYFVSVLFTAKV